MASAKIENKLKILNDSSRHLMSFCLFFFTWCKKNNKKTYVVFRGLRWRWSKKEKNNVLSIHETCANTSTDKSICWSICRLPGRPDCADWEGRGQDGGGRLQLQPQLSTVIAHHHQAKQDTSAVSVLLGNRYQSAVGQMNVTCSACKAIHSLVERITCI